MSKKKAAKAKTARGIRNLPAKTLSAKQARKVRGGHEFLEVKLKEVLVSGGVSGDGSSGSSSGIGLQHEGLHGTTAPK